MFTALLPAFCIFLKSEIVIFLIPSVLVITSGPLNIYHTLECYDKNHFNVYSIVGVIQFHFTSLSVTQLFCTRRLLIYRITIKGSLSGDTSLFSHSML